MTGLRVRTFSISVDGYAAGPHQDLEEPLGIGGELLHEWMFPDSGPRTAVDDRFASRADDRMGATIEE